MVLRSAHRTPHTAYLAPANGAIMNIWVADPTTPSSAHQLTDSLSDIYDYSVSPDGGKIAFTEKNTNACTMDINLLDMDTGEIKPLTNCADAECKTPVWRPDGQQIAYERIELNTSLQINASLTRKG
ncbi:MAG: hypothetical protein ABI970_15100 [Chloroflexota bacterium]